MSDPSGASRRVRQWVRDVLPRGISDPLRDWLADRRHARDLAAYQTHPTLPPPHAVKVATVLDFARRYRLGVLIETGTFEGEMARRCRSSFRRICTIELDPSLAERSGHRLARFPNVRLYPGDSARRLPEILSELSEPALFWLDGHYSGPGTARGNGDTPLRAELEAIRSHGRRGHVVLVDDARELGGGDYPSLAEMAAILRGLDPGYQVSVEEDIVRCVPGSVGAN